MSSSTLRDDELVLSEMFRATKPGGGIIVTVPQHQFLWSVVDEHAFHKRRYSRVDLVSKVERAGFRVARVTSFVSLLLPLMLLSRRTRNMDARHLRPFAEFHIKQDAEHGTGEDPRHGAVRHREGRLLSGWGSLLLVAKREAM